MRKVTRKQLPVSPLVRAVIIAMVITGGMVVTGCSTLKQPDAYTKHLVCFDHGRAGYWCPKTSTPKTASISEERAGAKNDLLQNPLAAPVAPGPLRFDFDRPSWVP